MSGLSVGQGLLQRRGACHAQFAGEKQSPGLFLVRLTSCCWRHAGSPSSGSALQAVASQSSAPSDRPSPRRRTWSRGPRSKASRCLIFVRTQRHCFQQQHADAPPDPVVQLGHRAVVLADAGRRQPSGRATAGCSTQTFGLIRPSRSFGLTNVAHRLHLYNASRED